MAHACNPRYSGGRTRRISFKVTPGKSLRFYVKKKLKQKGLRVWFKW
jgi:hypothetical protein